MSKMLMSAETKKKAAQAMVDDLFVIEPNMIRAFLVDDQKVMIAIAWEGLTLDSSAEHSAYADWRLLSSWETREEDLLQQIDEWIESSEDQEVKEDVEFMLLSFAIEQVAADLFIVWKDQSMLFRSEAAAARAIRAGIKVAKEKALSMLLESSAWDRISTNGN
jgi:hypothetical protein